MAESTATAKTGVRGGQVGAKKKGSREPAAWMLSRLEQGQWLRCYWHESGEKQEMWSLPLPSSEGIAKRWGSGTYKLTLLSHKGQVCGSRRLPAIDDPERPPRPTYPNAPSRNGTAKKEAPVNPVEAMAAGSAGAHVQAMIQGIQLYQQMDFTARNFAAQEAEQRVQRYRQEAELSMERERQFFQTQMKQQQLFFERLSAVPSQPIDDLREELEERIDAMGEGDDDDGDPKKALVRVVREKVSEIPGEAIGDLLKGLAEAVKGKK